MYLVAPVTCCWRRRAFEGHLKETSAACAGTIILFRQHLSATYSKLYRRKGNISHLYGRFDRQTSLLTPAGLTPVFPWRRLTSLFISIFHAFVHSFGFSKASAWAAFMGCFTLLYSEITRAAPLLPSDLIANTIFFVISRKKWRHRITSFLLQCYDMMCLESLLFFPLEFFVCHACKI